jgi:hypothetical protein
MLHVGADVWLRTRVAGGAGGGPSFPPLVGGVKATIAADFVGGQYWAGGTSQASFAAWLTAIAGTFSRASTATYIDGGIVKTAAVNVPRLGAAGFRLTGAGTNLHLQSQFASGWQADVGDTLTLNAAAAPDGTTTAVSHVPVNASHQHSVLYGSGTNGFVTGTTYTFSVFAKANGYTNVQLDLDNSGNCAATFQLSGAGSVLSKVGSTVASIIQLANGWYLCSITGAGSYTGNINSVIYTTGNGTARAWTGDGTSGYFFWGAQCTQSAFQLDYIPTTTATVTQAADLFSRTPTNPALTLFTKLVNFVAPGINANNKVAWSVGSSGTVQNSLIATVSKNTNFYTITNQGAVVSTRISDTVVTPNAFYKTAFAVQTNSLRASINGGSISVGTVTDPGMPTGMTMEILGGTVFGPGAELNGYVTAEAEWQVFASDMDLQNLTASVAFPSWLPTANNTYATIYADFTTSGNYWYNGQRASFNAWLTALGGTYSRASTATYIAAGAVQTAIANTPRFPTDLLGNPLGIRLTGSATNLLIHSQTFSDPSWVTSASTVSDNAVTAPDGTNTAAAFHDDATSGTHFIRLPSATYTAAPLTISVFVKSFQIGQLVITDPTGTIGTGFNTNQGVAFTVSGITRPTSDHITQLANGWFLCSMTYTPTAGATGSPGIFYLMRGTLSYTGDTSNDFLWGAQVTQTSFPVDYIPTTTATVTQAADSLSFPYTQTTFTALIGTNNQNTLPPGANCLQLGAAAANAEALIYSAHSTTQFSSFYNGATLLGPTFTGGLASLHKTAIAGNNSGRFMTTDGAVPTSDASALTSAALTSLSINSYDNGSSPGYGNYTQLAIWNNLVASTAEMQRLTTISSALFVPYFSCPSGFGPTGACGVDTNNGQAFFLTGAFAGSNPGLVGSAVEVVQANSTHVANNLNFQKMVSVQQFSTTFTFVPDGWNISLVFNNSNNGSANGSVFSGGAGCEASFFQAFSQSAPPNFVFALEFDSQSWLTLASGAFSYSSVQIYAPGVQPPGNVAPGQSPCIPDLGGTNFTYVAVDKISTAPVNLTTGAALTSTGHVYSATVTYDGSNLTVKLSDVTAGGPTFTHTWTGIDIPGYVGGNMAWVGIAGATNNPTPYPLHVNSWTYSALP